jgi:hypothetical protein
MVKKIGILVFVLELSSVAFADCPAVDPVQKEISVSECQEICLAADKEKNGKITSIEALAKDLTEGESDFSIHQNKCLEKGADLHKMVLGIFLDNKRPADYVASNAPRYFGQNSLVIIQCLLEYFQQKLEKDTLTRLKEVDQETVDCIKNCMLKTEL